MCIIKFRLGYVKEAVSIIVWNIFIRIEIFLLIELVNSTWSLSSLNLQTKEDQMYLAGIAIESQGEHVPFRGITYHSTVHRGGKQT